MDAEDVQLYSESKTRVQTSAEKRISPCSNRTCSDPQTQLMFSVFIGSDLMAPQDGDAKEHYFFCEFSSKPAMHKKDEMVNKCANHSEASYHAKIEKEGDNG